MKKLFRFRPRIGHMFMTSYIGDEEIVTIPETNYSDETVTAISRNCFFKCDKKIRYKIKEIIIPDTVRLIEKDAFYDLKNLEKITLPYELRYIEQYAFRYCEKLTEITFHPNLKSIGSYAFNGCVSLKKINCLADNVYVSKNAFEYCDSLEEISYNFLSSLPFYIQLKVTIKSLLNYESITSDMQSKLKAFINKKPKLKKTLFLCNKLEVITILLENIVNVKLPELNVYLEHHIKHENTTITALFLEYKNKNFSQKKLAAYEENLELVELGFELPTLKQLNKKWSVDKYQNEILITAYKGDNSTAEIPEKTKGGKPISYIGCGKEYAKYDYFKLKSLILPEGLKEILSYAFMNTILEYISLPQSLTRIHEYAFAGCKQLKEINLPDSIKAIEYCTFADCHSLTEIIVPSQVETISQYAFSDCVNLERIVLPQGLEVIEKDAFASCKQLKEINLPDNIKTIEYGTFSNCHSLTEIIVPSQVKTISQSAFSDCINLERIVLPQGLEVIEIDAFENCENIKEIVIFSPEKITIDCNFFKAELEKRNLL